MDTPKGRFEQVWCVGFGVGWSRWGRVGYFGEIVT
jgi:hypothetical protein